MPATKIRVDEDHKKTLIYYKDPKMSFLNHYPFLSANLLSLVSNAQYILRADECLSPLEALYDQLRHLSTNHITHGLLLFYKNQE